MENYKDSDWHGWSPPQGPIVNSEDLHEALVSGQIFGAGLDVLTGEPDIPADHPLLALDNCESFLGSHNGLFL